MNYKLVLILQSLILISLIFVFFLTFTVQALQPLTIAFVPKSLDNPIFLDTFEAAEEKAKELGVKLEWVAPFSTRTESQVKVVKNLIKEHVDGIIISANNSDSLRQVIDKAVSLEIPVITFDSDSPGSKRLSYIGTDNYKAGIAMGKALIEVINKKNVKERSYNIMILSGDKGALNLAKRVIGFNKTIKEDINVNNTEILYCHDNIQLAIELVEDYIQTHPELDIIFFVGGWPFYAPADAMPNFQKWAAGGGIAVGIDIFYSALVLQKEGLIDLLIGQDFESMGKKSLKYLVDYLRRGEDPPSLIHTGFNYAREDNLGKLLKIYKPWEVR